MVAGPIPAERPCKKNPLLLVCPVRAVEIVRMEKMVGLFAKRLSKVFLVQLLDIWVFVALAQRLPGIFLIQGLRTGLQHIEIPVMQRLTAAADATARASHDFDHMVLATFVTDVFQKLAGIPQSMRYPHLEREAVEVDGRFPQSFQSPNLRESHFFKLLAKHCRQEHTVGFYADKLNRTPKYLSGAIRKLSGRSVPEWITMNLLRESKSMLKTTGMTVLEISEDLNFSSPSVFVQFFRRHTGITPLQYRRRG